MAVSSFPYCWFLASLHVSLLCGVVRASPSGLVRIVGVARE